jgi:hypothetical protein
MPLVMLDGWTGVSDGRVDGEVEVLVLGGMRNVGIWRGVVRVIRITLEGPMSADVDGDTSGFSVLFWALR